MLKSVILYRSDKSKSGEGISGRAAAEQLRKKAEEHGICAVIMEIDERKPGHGYYFAIVESDPDLVFTIDFAGFSMSTETGDVAYINLRCRNIHLILEDREQDYERYLSRKLSIAMFFYCRDHGICEKLQNRYPDIPYLKAVKNWDDMLEDVLTEAV